MKPKTLISLAILPVVALAGCDSSKTKVASSNTTKNANGAYQKCNPNDPKTKTNCNSSSSGGGGGYVAGGSGSEKSNAGKSGSKGGFGGSAGHSGG